MGSSTGSDTRSGVSPLRLIPWGGLGLARSPHLHREKGSAGAASPAHQPDDRAVTQHLWGPGEGEGGAPPPANPSSYRRSLVLGHAGQGVCLQGEPPGAPLRPSHWPGDPASTSNRGKHLAEGVRGREGDTELAGQCHQADQSRPGTLRGRGACRGREDPQVPRKATHQPAPVHSRPYSEHTCFPGPGEVKPPPPPC